MKLACFEHEPLDCVKETYPQLEKDSLMLYISEGKNYPILFFASEDYEFKQVTAFMKKYKFMINGKFKVTTVLPDFAVFMRARSFDKAKIGDCIEVASDKELPILDTDSHKAISNYNDAYSAVLALYLLECVFNVDYKKNEYFKDVLKELRRLDFVDEEYDIDIGKANNAMDFILGKAAPWNIPYQSILLGGSILIVGLNLDFNEKYTFQVKGKLQKVTLALLNSIMIGRGIITSTKNTISIIDVGLDPDVEFIDMQSVGPQKIWLPVAFNEIADKYEIAVADVDGFCGILAHLW